ncbi:hypothetical protein [Aquimarina sp. 2201CG5-10]|uniref:hypothetical protein n=1 Tax=Aquimarina callyspongiae TaxID=3098150 RepID=UPI002AB53914|nr:hypothetical protein [Aquimarina sp. 2201CG5-10]MDY8135878.1 hypothetical protein [Aquimarina sp. 2201CG5-10]
MKVFNKRRFFASLLTIGVLLLFSSCYSVRLTSTKGAPMPCQAGIDCPEDKSNYYRDKMVIVLDTVVKAGATIDDIGLRVQRENCESGKLFSVEYKNTFGGALLYLVTFGSKRKVKIKYVCMKPEN